MVISTNQKLTIYRNLYENTGPGEYDGSYCTTLNLYSTHAIKFWRETSQEVKRHPYKHTDSMPAGAGPTLNQHSHPCLPRHVFKYDIPLSPWILLLPHAQPITLWKPIRQQLLAWKVGSYRVLNSGSGTKPRVRINRSTLNLSMEKQLTIHTDSACGQSLNVSQTPSQCDYRPYRDSFVWRGIPTATVYTNTLRLLLRNADF